MPNTGKIAVVTGASMGIGLAIAKLFAARGASVVMAARDLGRLETARASVGFAERTMAVACDVSRHADLTLLLNAAMNRFGRVDIWINNAGLGLQDSVAGMDMAGCRRMFDVNLFGAIDAMQAVIPVMKQQGGGCIINISSVAGHIAVPYMAAYCATKHALNAISKAARVELWGSGIHVLTVCPGYVRTDFSANTIKGGDRRRLAENVRRGIPAERVARAVLRGYTYRQREVVVPWSNWIAIKAYQHAPKIVEWSMAQLASPPKNSPENPSTGANH